MAKIEVIMPKMGEGVIEATITRWLVGNKATVLEDEPIVEIATDKVDSEIPSPSSGTIIKRFFREGETVKVGEIIAIIETNNHDDKLDEILINSIQSPTIFIKSEAAKRKRKSIKTTIKSDSSDGIKIEPFIRFFAKQRGLSNLDLMAIEGTGPGGKVTQGDVQNYFKSPKTKSKHIVEKKKEEDITISETYEPKEGEEVIELDKTRKLIAEHMVRSVKVAPHVTSFVEADVTPLVQWRESVKEEFLKKHGVKLTYTPVFADVVIKSLKQFRDINVSLFQDKLIRKKYINIGMATALPGGNLVVPVIKDADKINFSQLAINLADITKRAREGKLIPGETSGGTFTITNLAMVENVTGTPIINQPESAILAVGAIRKRPWVIEYNGEHVIGIRDIVMLALSYDHRIVDGALGGAFLNNIAALLEQFSPYEW